MTLKSLLHEYDENLKIVNELRRSIRLNSTQQKLQELGAHLLWRQSLRLQILQLYFRDL